ncbi:MAG TPA: hypothetical protein VEI95_08210 [Acidobacteriota bacterium]|nr:hypothetical protein [Pseudolabrys sp.]HYA28786.1 hypothetical protein [Acidobacteriota bacterium]
MRIFFSIVLLTVLIAAIASIDTTTAKQHTTLSIDPLGMMATTTGLTTVQYDAF